MDPSLLAAASASARKPAGLDIVERENSLREIANNYVEDEELDNTSSEDRGITQDRGHEMQHTLGDTSAVAFGAENGGESAHYEERTDTLLLSLDKEHLNDGLEILEEEGEVGIAVSPKLSHHKGVSENANEPAKGPREDKKQGGFSLQNKEEPSSEVLRTGIEKQEEERADAVNTGSANGFINGVEGAEKRLTDSEDGFLVETVEGQPGPTLRRRRGRPLKSNGRKASMRVAPITPKLEEPRAVRSNRGVKRRFPGDESEDSLPKRIRVRSIASVCGDSSQTIKGEDFSMDEGMKIRPARKRGRPRKSETLLQQVLPKEDEVEAFTSPNVGKRKMVEAVLESDTVKRPCHGRNGHMMPALSKVADSRENNKKEMTSNRLEPFSRGPLFACNAEGCKKRFAEAAALYIHARVHGDRPYVCHYDGCIKSFSERSKLKRHFLIHTGEKPFLCDYEGCGKAFSLDFNLRSHMKTHTGDYHECPYDGCEKRYCQEYKLRAHIGKEHSKPVRGLKKLVTVVGNNVRGANGSITSDATATKKKQMLSALETKRAKLEGLKQGRVSRIAELEAEKEQEAAELVRVEQDLRKCEREQRQLEEGHVGSPAVSLSASEDEDADDEEGEDMAPSNATTEDSSSSGEQQSRLANSPLEYMAMGEERDVLMFDHQLPTADQGARLVKTMEAQPDSLQHEPTTSLTPLLWLQGAPPHQGHLAANPALRPFLRSRRPMPIPDVGKPTKFLQTVANPVLGAKENSEQQKRVYGDFLSQGDRGDSGLGVATGEGRAVGGVRHDGGLGKSRGKLFKNSVILGGGTGLSSASNMMKDKFLVSMGENGKVDLGVEMREREQTKPSKQQSFQNGRQFSSTDQVFVSMNPILLSTDHGFSPTDSRFLAANEGFSALAQGSLRDGMQPKEGSKLACAGQSSGPKEKVFRSMNEVLHSTDQGGFACMALNEGFVVPAEEAPSEQSFEPSAAQLFTYHEQPRLVD